MISLRWFIYYLTFHEDILKTFLFLLLSALFPFVFLSADNKVDPKAQEILDFWFGPIKTVDDFPKDKIILWFGKKDDIDKDMRNQYEYLVQAAANHELDTWTSTPQGRLALIILLDQMPRNIYRDTPQAFAYDAQAVQLTLDGFEKGDDQNLLPIERAFFYFPLMHAENTELQELSVKKYKTLVPSAPASLRSNYKSYEDFALRHYDVIMKFGRFPHRNKVLCRQSTREELDFLKTPGSSF